VSYFLEIKQLITTFWIQNKLTTKKLSLFKQYNKASIFYHTGFIINSKQC